jgi:hypothetical protein
MNKSYNFENLEGNSNAYGFSTINNFNYYLEFTPTPYFLGENSKFADNLFELSIHLINNIDDRKPGIDAKVAITVAEIIVDFFEKNLYTVCIYICDSSDGRQLVRSWKFHQWFQQLNKSNFLKLDETLLDKNKERFPVSMIIHTNNEYAGEIIMEFINIARVMNEGK